MATIRNFLLSIFCRSDFAVLAMLDMVGFVLPHVLTMTSQPETHYGTSFFLGRSAVFLCGDRTLLMQPHGRLADQWARSWGLALLGPMLLSLPWLFRTPAQCSAVERTRSLSAPVCALALLLLGASSLFSGQMMIATGNSDNGLFIADYLTQDDLNYLAGKYPETLDKAIVLTAPDESVSGPRRDFPCLRLRHSTWCRRCGLLLRFR